MYTYNNRKEKAKSQTKTGGIHACLTLDRPAGETYPMDVVDLTASHNPNAFDYYQGEICAGTPEMWYMTHCF